MQRGMHAVKEKVFGNSRTSDSQQPSSLGKCNAEIYPQLDCRSDREQDWRHHCTAFCSKQSLSRAHQAQQCGQHAARTTALQLSEQSTQSNLYIDSLSFEINKQPRVTFTPPQGFLGVAVKLQMNKCILDRDLQEHVAL